jgi:hypothetical protein
LPGPRIDSGQIRAFVKIPTMTCQCQVGQIIGAAVLLRDDVFDMVDQFVIILVRAAVFAAFASPPANQIPRRPSIGY